MDDSDCFAKGVRSFSVFRAVSFGTDPCRELAFGVVESIDEKDERDFNIYSSSCDPPQSRNSSQKGVVGKSIYDNESRLQW